jgi:flagellar biogenesis protein FliO
MTPQPDKAQTEQASTSVRVAILVFIGSLVLLFVMGVIWLFVRVDAPQSAQVSEESALGLVAPWKDFSLSKRCISVLDDNRGPFFR